MPLTPRPGSLHALTVTAPAASSQAQPKPALPSIAAQPALPRRLRLAIAACFVFLAGLIVRM
jgi:hypothetical protein